LLLYRDFNAYWFLFFHSVYNTVKATVAFKIIPKINPTEIQDRSLDIGFLGKYYKQLQQLLIQKTTAETPTDYFFCEEFSGGEDLLVMGDQTMAYQKVFWKIIKIVYLKIIFF